MFLLSWEWDSSCRQMPSFFICMNVMSQMRLLMITKLCQVDFIAQFWHTDWIGFVSSLRWITPCVRASRLCVFVVFTFVRSNWQRRHFFPRLIVSLLTLVLPILPLFLSLSVLQQNRRRSAVLLSDSRHDPINNYRQIRNISSLFFRSVKAVGQLRHDERWKSRSSEEEQQCPGKIRPENHQYPRGHRW